MIGASLRIEPHALHLEHRVSVEEFMLMRPGEEPGYCGLLSRSHCGAKMKMHAKKVPQHLHRNPFADPW
jgi:hypothetical protein